MLATAAFALALMSGQEPVVIGNANRRPPARIRAVADGVHQPGPGTDQTRGEQICRDEPVTGSRFPKRVCHTRFEADGERQEGRSVLRRMQGSRTPDILG